MRKLIIGLTGLLILVSGCTFIGNVSNYKNTSKDLINQIVKEDYKKAYDNFAYKKYGGDIPIDTFAKQLKPFRELIIKNFGTDFDLSFVRASKTTFKTGESGPHPTEIYIQIKNATQFGYFRIEYDDEINKIMNINIQPMIEPIPSMTLFWFFGLIPLLILGFNIYTIRRTLKSSISKKWLRILMIIILNVPAFTYSVVNGFSFGLLSFQVLLGLSFGMMGYAGTFWTFGLPIGSMIVNYQINKKKVEAEIDDLAKPKE